MAWATTRILYSVVAADFTVILGGGGAPNVTIPSLRGLAIRNDTAVSAIIYGTSNGGSTWSSVMDAIADHPATACTGAAVGDHGASTSSTPSADNTASDTASITVGGSTDNDTASITVGGATDSDTASITVGGSTDNDTASTLIPMAAPGAWAVDGDGAETNGGGFIGHAITLTQVATLENLVFDVGTGEYETIETAGATWRTANYAILPDAPANDDAFMVMYSIPFPEVAFDMSATLATYTGIAGKWQMSTGPGTWVDVSTIYDNTNAAVHTGDQPLARDGALVMAPEATWASATYGTKTGYWLRWVVTDATKITQVGVMNTKRAEIVTAEQGWAPPADLDLAAVYFSDFAITLHTAADVKLLLWDQTSGASKVVTFAQDKRQEIVALGAAWALTTAARIVTAIVQEDGTNEPLSALLGVYCDVVHKHGATGLTATDAGHTHGATGLTATDAGHGHTLSGAATATDAGHAHGPGLHTHDTTPPTHSVTQPSTPILGHSIT